MQISFFGGPGMKVRRVPGTHRVTIVHPASPVVTRILGTITAPSAALLQIIYADGTRATIPFVWVTRPIAAGFFAYDVPDGRLSGPGRPTGLVLSDGHGKVLAREAIVGGLIRQVYPAVQSAPRPATALPKTPDGAVGPAAARRPATVLPWSSGATASRSSTCDALRRIASLPGALRLPTSASGSRRSSAFSDSRVDSLPRSPGSVFRGGPGVRRRARAVRRLRHQHRGRASLAGSVRLACPGRNCIDSRRPHVLREPGRRSRSRPVRPLCPAAKCVATRRSDDFQQLWRRRSGRRSRDSARQPLRLLPAVCGYVLVPDGATFVERSTTGKRFTVTIVHRFISHQNLAPYSKATLFWRK